MYPAIQLRPPARHPASYRAHASTRERRATCTRPTRATVAQTHPAADAPEPTATGSHARLVYREPRPKALISACSGARASTCASSSRFDGSGSCGNTGSAAAGFGAPPCQPARLTIRPPIDRIQTRALSCARFPMPDSALPQGTLPCTGPTPPPAKAAPHARALPTRPWRKRIPLPVRPNRRPPDRTLGLFAASHSRKRSSAHAAVRAQAPAPPPHASTAPGAAATLDPPQPASVHRPANQHG
jgi:hypothetical protein